MSGVATSPRILIYLLRRDLRVADNPILHEIARLHKENKCPYTHLLPLYVFPAQQVEVSGFLAPDATQSPYREARSQVGGFWRCGPHRAKFLADSVWNVKEDLEALGSGLVVRVGMLGDVVKGLLETFQETDDQVTAVWLTAEDALEEQREERDVRRVAEAHDVKFRAWKDEKYFVDDRDLPPGPIADLPDVFTSFRKSVEPLRERPRKPLAKPVSLPPMPESIPPSQAPFVIPDSSEEIISALLKPLDSSLGLEKPPEWPEGTRSAHPYRGGEREGHERIRHLITSGSMTTYKDTRNGLLGTDFSTKLSAWLALGCITARQVHHYLLEFENGTTELGKGAPGYGNGENNGTAAVRFELLWRDYMRLCTRKFGARLFDISGFRADESTEWKYVDGAGRSSRRGDASGVGAAPEVAAKNNSATYTAAVGSVEEAFQRFLAGRTGTGLIDASQRELFLTGYTSNRARQNVASYLSRHLGIDWRLGAEWYESLLIDYDVYNNWGNWQYVAGVGNDPRAQNGPGTGRIFNPVKQALDYDAKGEYVAAWVPELREIQRRAVAGAGADGAPPDGDKQQALMGVFQAWRLPKEDKEKVGLVGQDWVEHPLVRIQFSVGRGRGGGGGGDGRGRGWRGRGRGFRGGNRRGQGRGGPRPGDMRSALAQGAE